LGTWLDTTVCTLSAKSPVILGTRRSQQTGGTYPTLRGNPEVSAGGNMVADPVDWLARVID
jgi:hypothetical protein